MVDFSQFQSQKVVVQEVKIPAIQEEKKIIESEILEKYLPEVEKTKVKVDRKKSKPQLMVRINRNHKKDQELPKRQQRIPMEIYRAFDLIIRIFKER